MQRINVAIIGWGNVGRGCKRAIEESKDLVLTGVVRRPASLLKNLDELKNTKVVSDIQELDKVDWKHQPVRIRKQYQQPLALLRARYALQVVGSRVKQMVLNLKR